MTDFLQKCFSNSIFLIYNSIMLLGLVVGTMRFLKLSRSSKIFLLLLLLTFFKEMLSFYHAITKGDNSSLSNGFMILEFSIISLAFYFDTNSRIFLKFFLSFLLFGLIDNLWSGAFFTYQNYRVELLAGLLIIIMFFTFMVKYFKTDDKDAMVNFPLFWFGVGFLLFSIVSIISFGFTEIAEKGSYWHKIAGYSIRYSNYLLYLLFVPAFLSPQKRLIDYTAG